MKITSLFTAAVLVLPPIAMADNILDSVIYSTGVDSNGNVVNGGSADSHFTTTGTNVTTGPAAVLSSGNLYPSWTPDNATGTLGSAWIGVDNGIGQPSTPYTFTESFNLTGYDATSVALAGTYWGDDIGYLAINGNVIGSFYGNNDGGLGWNPGYAFSVNGLSGDFVSGVNTITMTMTASDDYYDGVRLDITTATADAVGAPDNASSLMLFGIGLAGLAGMAAARRRLVRA